MNRIVGKRNLNETTVYLEIESPGIAETAQPGQFVILRIDEKGERIPLTIADYDPKKGVIAVIVQMIGFSTRLLGSLEVDDFILDLAGPLGKPSELSGFQNVAVIGGGVGCAIAYPQAKHLFNNSVDVDIIAGFRNKEAVILEKEMREVSSNLYITTDDGSYEEKGFVTQKLQELIESGRLYDAVVAIGPVVMMKAVSEITRTYKIKTIVSLNPIMIDGTGMCGGCRVSVGGKTMFACVDGPDFDAHDVDFDILIKRNTAYKTQENNLFEHSCRIYGDEK